MTNHEAAITSILISATVAARFHGDGACSSFPSIETGARPASMKQTTSAVCATAIRTTVCTNDIKLQLIQRGGTFLGHLVAVLAGHITDSEQTHCIHLHFRLSFFFYIFYFWLRMLD